MYNVIMEEIKFEWDENKNAINQKKHHVSFEEAKKVFYDEDALVIDDPDHSEEEDRFIILGCHRKQICWWFVIAIALRTRSFG